MENIEVKLADRPDLMKTAASIRYKSYRSVDAIPANDDEVFYDVYDENPNTYTYLAFQEGVPIGSIRACIKSAKEGEKLPAETAYQPTIDKLIREGNNNIVESNRFVIDPESNVKKLPVQLALFRVIVAHATLQKATYIITAVRKKHISFYKRTMKFLPQSEEQCYPGLSVPMILMSVNFSEEGIAEVAEKIPQFRITSEDARKITGK